MGKKSELKNIIDNKIKPNGKEEITGEVLNAVLQKTIDHIPDEEFLSNVVSGLQGSITPMMMLEELNELKDGIYEAQTAGTYANGLVAKEGYFTRFRKEGEIWTLAMETNVPVVPIVKNAMQRDDYQKGIRPGNSQFNPEAITEGFYFNTLTADLAENDAYFVSDFIEILPDTSYKLSVYRRFIIFYDANKNIIGGNSDIGETVLITPIDCNFIRIDGALGAIDGIFIIEGSVKPQSVVFSEKANYSKIEEPIWKIILHNDTSYNAIRTLAEKLYLEANHFNRYEIVLFEGNYNETDWKGFGDYVKIRGENRDNCIINFDGNSSNILPDDYSFESESGKEVNAVAQHLKHIVFAMRNCLFEDLTFFAKNCKYPVHADNIGYKNLSFLNCRIKDDNCNFPVGIGIWGGQKIDFKKCIIERAQHWHLAWKGIFAHNWNAQKSPAEINILDCSFVNCSYISIYENGSNCFDKLNLINCTTDSIAEIEYGVSQDSDGKTFWTNLQGIKVANPTQIPYNFKINTSGTIIDYIEDSSSFVGFPSSRPNWFLYTISDYFGKAKLVSGNIERGDLISSQGDSANNNSSRVRKFQGFISDLPPLGVSLQNAATDEFIYFVKIGNIAKVKLTGGGVTNYNGNSRKLFFDEVTKTFKSDSNLSSKNTDALAYENDIDFQGLLAARTKKII